MNKPRLIDADELKRYIDDCDICYRCPDKKVRCSYDCDFPDFLTSKMEFVINEQPTAYDIEKVVEQLKQEQKNPNSYVYAWDAYEKAIEIVKDNYSENPNSSECVVDANKTSGGGAE